MVRRDRLDSLSRRVIAARRWGCCLLLASTSSCNSLFTSPSSPAYSGIYVLDQIDGNALPVAAPGVGQDGPCPTLATDGSLGLAPAGVDHGQLYMFSVADGPGCDALQAALHPSAIAGATGKWNGDGNTVQFTVSRDDKTIGSFNGVVSSASSGYVLTFTFQSHQYRWRRVRPYPPQGASLIPVQVSIMDEAGQPVNGANLLFQISDGEVQRGNGTLVPTGDSVRIYVNIPVGYTMPPNQPNPLTVVVPGPQPLSLTVTLARGGT